GVYLPSHLLHLYRSAQRASARSLTANSEAAIPRAEGKRKREGQGTSQAGGLAPRPSQIEISAVASEAECRRRHSRRLLRSLGCSQLLLAARIRAPDRLAFSNMAASAYPGWQAAIGRRPRQQAVSGRDGRHGSFCG